MMGGPRKKAPKTIAVIGGGQLAQSGFFVSGEGVLQRRIVRGLDLELPVTDAPDAPIEAARGRTRGAFAARLAVSRLPLSLVRCRPRGGYSSPSSRDIQFD